MAPAQPNTIANALLTAQNLYETYAAPILPPPVNSLVSTILSGALTAQPYASGIWTQSSTLMSNFLTGNGNGNDDGSSGSGITSIILLLVTVYLLFKITNYVRRTIFGWVFLAIKLVILLVVIQAAFYVYTHGFEESVDDARWISRILWRLAEIAFGGDDFQKKTPKGMRGRNNGNGRDQVPMGWKGWV